MANGNEVETLVNLASATLMHTDPAKGCCYTDCFYREVHGSQSAETEGTC